jgi:membrane protein
MLSENDAPADTDERLSEFYNLANKLTFGAFDILRQALRRFIQERGPEAAAGTAFFTVFSLFPLLLVLVAIGSSLVLGRQQVLNQIIQFVRLTFPNPELVVTNLQNLLENRGSIGIIGGVGLAWSATGALTILSRNINRAWPNSRPRNFIESRAIAFIMIAIMLGLLILSSLTATILDLLAKFSEPLFGVNIFTGIPFFDFLTNLVPFAIGLILFAALYRWVPNTRVPWKAAFWAAVVAAAAWQIGTFAFAYYLKSGVAQYQLLYGTLGTIVALMFWIYLNYMIILFGAYLSAAIAHHRKNKQ